MTQNEWNAVKASKLITEDYKRYLQSLLNIADPKLRNALEEKILRTSDFARGPFIEANPALKLGMTLNQLIEEGVVPETMRLFGSSALPLDRNLYSHQEQALRAGVQGNDLIVSTGTGSGKTESFLLPILARLAAEIEAGTLGPGVRALLLYPMNALANDQMKRLRQLLANVPQVTFGRYIGETLEKREQAQQLFTKVNPAEPVLPNELMSREEMRDTPPNLLLTNYAMLEYLLLRPLDTTLFDVHSGNEWRFIVVDEAHTYDGTLGAELGMLMRRLKHRVAAPKTQHFATSATVGAESNPDEVREFAKDLFDADSLPELITATKVVISDGTWGPLTAQEIDEWYESDDKQSWILLKASSQGRTFETAYEAAAEEKTIGRVRKMAADIDSVSRLSDSLDGDFTPESIFRVTQLAGMLTDHYGTPLMQSRFHLWIRSSEGAFTCLNSAKPHVSLERNLLCNDCNTNMYEFGTCKRCGALHLFGTDEVSENKHFLKPRGNDEGRGVWVALDTSHETEGDEDDELLDGSDDINRKTQKFCGDCGRFLNPDAGSCDVCSSSNVRTGEFINKGKDSLNGCLKCGYRSSGAVRRFESGQDASTSVLTTSLYQAIPEATDRSASHPGGGRKTLLFSDSRQSAAGFAPYMSDSYEKFLFRRLILQGLKKEAGAGNPKVEIETLATTVAMLAAEKSVVDPMLQLNLQERSSRLWIMVEALATDERMSLEGVGLLGIEIDTEISPDLLAPLTSLGLEPKEAKNFVLELLKTLRTRGSVTMPEFVSATDDAFAPRLGPIYFRGQGSEPKKRVLAWSPASKSNQRVDYASKVLSKISADIGAKDLIEGIWQEIILRLTTDTSVKAPVKVDNVAGLGVVYRLNHRALKLWGTTGENLYRCDVCQKYTPISVKDVCPTSKCAGTLQLLTIDENHTLDNPHLDNLYRNLDPIPLRIEEHTAQYESVTAAEIQAAFIEGKVNALSCSTTFELGVDVGDLQSVLLRNVPPRTANYLQRAGRAGRRTGSSALVVTFSRRGSHDLTHFRDPKKMISGLVRPPFISHGNVRLDRRHVHSLVLGEFLKSSLPLSLAWNSAGSFFTSSDQAPSVASLFAEYAIQNKVEFDESIRSILSEKVYAEISQTDWTIELSELLETVQKSFQDEVSAYRAQQMEALIAEKGRKADRFKAIISTLNSSNLIGYLAKRNILPKYGFPVDVVPLKTAHATVDVGRRLDLDRDLKLAIYEYAPGNTVIAGGYRWESAGLTTVPGKGLPSGWYYECRTCNNFEYGLEIEGKPNACSSCASGVNAFKYLEPTFGFVAAAEPTKATTAPRKNSWSGSTYVASTGHSPVEHPTRFADIRIFTSVRATLMAISDGGQGGFFICEACGASVERPKKGQFKKHRHLIKTEVECGGSIDFTSLAHRFETDVLVIENLIGKHHSQVDALAVGYALKLAATNLLQISEDDIDVSLERSEIKNSVVIFDTVPGGAGVITKVAKNFGEVVERAILRLDECSCGEETSCYSCLRNYRNQKYHEHLSRGEALRILRGVK